MLVGRINQLDQGTRGPNGEFRMWNLDAFAQDSWKLRPNLTLEYGVRAGYWTNNARNIRIANLAVNSPCMLLYDVLVKSWGGALNEAVTLVSIIISIIRFGWKALDGDRIEA